MRKQRGRRQARAAAATISHHPHRVIGGILDVSHIIKRDKSSPVNFEGLDFLPFIKVTRPEFCNSVNSNISFTPKGCVMWAGTTRKRWVSDTEYITFPTPPHHDAVFSFFQTLYIFCYGKRLGVPGEAKVYPACGSSLCINPEHFSSCNWYTPLSRYLKTIEGVRPDKKQYTYYVISKDYRFAKEFTSFSNVREYCGVSSTGLVRYAKTGRLLKGEYYVKRELRELSEANEETCEAQ